MTNKYVEQLITEIMQLDSIHSPYKVMRVYDPESGKTSFNPTTAFEYFMELENENYDKLVEQEKMRLEDHKRAQRREFNKMGGYEKSYREFKGFKHKYSSFGTSPDSLLGLDARKERAADNSRKVIKGKKKEKIGQLYNFTKGQFANMKLKGDISEEQIRAIEEHDGNRFEWCLNALFVMDIIDLQSYGAYSPVFGEKGEMFGLHKKAEDKPEPIQERPPEYAREDKNKGED